MSEEAIRFGPRWWWRPACIAGIALGVCLFVLAPDPFANLALEGRPIKAALWFRVGGVVLALAALSRFAALKRLRLGERSLRVKTLLSRRRYGWATLEQVQDDPSALRVRFRDGTVVLARREFAPADLAMLQAVAQSHLSRANG